MLRAGKVIEDLRKNDGWGARIRTWEWRYQKPLPYRLATPQCFAKWGVHNRLELGWQLGFRHCGDLTAKLVFPLAAQDAPRYKTGLPDDFGVGV